MVREPKRISTSSSNEEVETNVDFKLSKSNDHDSCTSPFMTEHNDDCNVEDETRRHSGKLSNLV